VKLTGKQRKILRRILIAAGLLAVILLLPVRGWLRAVLYLLPFLCVGHPVLKKAGTNILHGQVFDENLLMTLAALGAFCIGEYAEAAVIMLFYQIGELFESVAVDRSRRSISALMDIRPDYANLLREGQWVETDPEEIRPGEVILIKPGEKIPLDGTVLRGSSSLNTTALTGESLPRDVEPGDSVISGCINLNGTLQVTVTRAYTDSTVAKILELVENSSQNKARTEKFITRFAAWYTPMVVAAALLVAVIPPLFAGGWRTWIHRALNFLVISCPCALVISVPLSYFGGIGGASRHGILIKGANHLEALASAGIAAFDKTGTLTRGSFTVTDVRPIGMDSRELLQLAASAESCSDHPIALSLKAACPLPLTAADDLQDIAGFGISARVNGREIHVGSEKLMERLGLHCPPIESTGNVVHVAADRTYAGSIIVSDTIKPEAPAALAALNRLGVKKTVMLTGDRPEAAREMAALTGIAQVHAQLLPGEKVERVTSLLREKSPGSSLLFIGDGINDAPVLACADVGIAMGSLGSDAAIEAADVVIMDDSLEKLPLAIRIARSTRIIVRENILFSLAVKAAIMVLSALGMVGIWAAVFADVGVSVIAILNAIRTMRIH